MGQNWAWDPHYRTLRGSGKKQSPGRGAGIRQRPLDEPGGSAEQNTDSRRTARPGTPSSGDQCQRLPSSDRKAGHLAHTMTPPSGSRNPQPLPPAHRPPRTPPAAPPQPQMGISKLSVVIMEAAPGAISSVPLHRYWGKVLAVDASVFLHQFDSAMPPIYNRCGDNISVLKGMFYRTAFLLENGIKPVYVFDGKPPHLKRRKSEAKGQRRSSSAETGVGAASDEPKIFLGPKVRKDLEEMLTHLGVPFIQAPSEAEATCAALVAGGSAWGTVTEDMDALPFGSTRLIQNLKATGKQNVQEYDLQKILTALKMDRNQFVDLCILLGCDYCDTIRGIGRKKALAMIRKHGNIEGILKAVKSDCVPRDFPYQETRKLLLEPDVVVVRKDELKWKEIDEENLIRFLCNKKFLKEKDVIKKLEKIRLEAAAPPKMKRKCPAVPSNQPRIDNLFPNIKSRRMGKDAHQ